MKVLHITPSSDGYEEVTLLANRVSKNNQLKLIKKDGVEYMTGGFILNSTPAIRDVLDRIPKEAQYEFVKQFKVDPFVKFYHETQKD